MTSDWMARLRSAMDRRPELAGALDVPCVPYSPHRPTVKQAAFLAADWITEILYGGAAGGGKSEALLMAALQHVLVPRYAAILFRRTYADLALSGALMDRAGEWLRNTAARWRPADHAWRFPSGATLSFGYLDREAHKHRYQSAEFQFIGFDELTQFTESQYRYLFSRLRKPSGLAVPLRMRAASNPGGPGHDWVRRRFLIESSPRRIFMPATLDDNPHLDRRSYVENLGVLDDATRAQLLDGDWNVDDDGLLSFDAIAGCEAECLWPAGTPLAGSRPELYVGVDVGRSRDLTVIWTWEKVGDVCWCREIATFENASFAEQRHAIETRLGRQVVRCAIDAGGIGCQLAEELKKRRPWQVEPVHLTSGVQGRIAQRLATAFAERLVRIPRDEQLRSDLRLVRKLRVVGGANRVQTARNETGHADRFWAAALGYDAALASSSHTASLPLSRVHSIAR